MPPLFRHRHRLLSGAVALPVITGFTPSAGAVGDPITITGINFGAARGIGSVVFTNTAASFSNSVTVPNILSWSDTQIVVKVPAGLTFPYPGSFIRVTTNTAQGASSAATFLWTGGAAAFAGASTQFGACPDNAALSMGAGVRMSFAFWLNPGAIGTTQYVFCKGLSTGANIEYLIRLTTTNAVSMQVGDGATLGAFTTAAVLPQATWSFLAGYYDGATIGVSINNGAYITAVFTTDIQNGTNAFRLGTRSDNVLPFTGSLDGVGLWKRVLTAGEITTLYNAGQGLSYAAALALGGGLLTNLAAWWDLDDAGGSGATWVDRLGVSNLTAGTGTAAPTSVRGVR